MDRYLKTLSDYSVSLSYDQLPPEVVHQVKRIFIDSMGCAIGGYMEDPPRMSEYASQVKGEPGATVLGTNHRTAAELAAFANGVMVRYLDFNDMYAGHASTNIPHVFAAAEYGGADAKKLITGIVLAYEVQGVLWSGFPVYRKGWDQTLVTMLGSCAGAGNVMGLNQEQMANALALATVNSIALVQTRQGSLSMWKGSAEGNAGRNGVFFATIAKMGMTGPAEAFEGSSGFLKFVSGPFELKPMGGKDQQFKVMESRFKFYPADHEVQVAAQPAVDISKLIKGKIEDIEHVLVEAYAGAVYISAESPAKWHPTARETADHSMPYGIARALKEGKLWMDDFEDQKVTDPEIQEFMQKIEVKENPDFTKDLGANHIRITVSMKSGEQISREIRYGKGHPKNPFSDKEVEGKFLRLTEPLLGSEHAGRILQNLWQLEKVHDLRQVMKMFELGQTE